jgi:23S rRNA (cytosine1962-C5)-methyltransferase
MATRVEIHPASIKHVKKSHPWITKDSFSQRFPKNPKFLSARIDEKRFCILMNDPEHPTIKARVWSIDTKSKLEEKDFLYELKGRLIQSFRLRDDQDFGRDNYYLCFGESDKVPGVFIQKLGDTILIQLYAEFWSKYERDLVRITREKYLNSNIWVQKRNQNKVKEFYCSTNKQLREDQFEVTEFGVNYVIKFNEYYDIGIYTDMAAIRNKVRADFEDKSVLNLYSYTGAYSLFALQSGASEVTSVDLSKKYLDWLDENLESNPSLDKSKHSSLCKPSEKALEQFVKEGRKFDVIVCDPPSSSSNGKKITKAIDAYKKLIPLIAQCLNKKGKAYVFLNTHSITRPKFESKIKEYIGDTKISISGALKLHEDCPSLKGFPEGDYLKGLILYKR